jgi:release factor glutamine methyltransferase
MTIKQLLIWGAKQLKNSDSPNLDSELLLSLVLKKDKAFLFTYPEKPLAKTQASAFKKLIKLRAKDWPIAYLTHTRNFFGLDFYVNENVLIPRPWTEGLVTEAVGTLKDRSGLKILDVGTGAGAIIVSLACALGKKNRYFASDYSAKALAIAKKNAKKQNVKITFIKSDLLKSIKHEFDIVTANLPYLERETNSSTMHEPKMALVSPRKGLKHYEDLLEQLSVWQKHPELLFLECEPKQELPLTILAKKFLPHTEVRITKDSSAVVK